MDLPPLGLTTRGDARELRLLLRRRFKSYYGDYLSAIRSPVHLHRPIRTGPEGTEQCLSVVQIAAVGRGEALESRKLEHLAGCQACQRHLRIHGLLEGREFSVPAPGEGSRRQALPARGGERWTKRIRLLKEAAEKALRALEQEHPPDLEDAELVEADIAEAEIAEAFSKVLGRDPPSIQEPTGQHEGGAASPGRPVG